MGRISDEERRRIAELLNWPTARLSAGASNAECAASLWRRAVRVGW